MPNRSTTTPPLHNPTTTTTTHTVDIYPLRNYYFGSKQPLSPPKDETLAERAQRMKANFADYGLRTCVRAVLVVELNKHPHVLVCQVKNSFFELPGGRLRPGESVYNGCWKTAWIYLEISGSALRFPQEIMGLKRKLTRKLCTYEDGSETDWEVGECIGMWWRPNFETLMYPHLPTTSRAPKECTKLFIVKLPVSRRFIVPKNFKVLAVPLYEIHENVETYGQIIAGVPLLVSKFSFNIIED